MKTVKAVKTVHFDGLGITHGYFVPTREYKALRGVEKAARKVIDELKYPANISKQHTANSHLQDKLAKLDKARGKK